MTERVLSFVLLAVGVAVGVTAVASGVGLLRCQELDCVLYGAAFVLSGSLALAVLGVMLWLRRRWTGGSGLGVWWWVLAIVEAIGVLWFLSAFGWF